MHGRILGLLVVLLWFPPFAGSGNAQEAKAGAGEAGAEVYLRPGDVVRLRVWREPDLSGEFTVDERGQVVLPKIGVQYVIEETPDELRERLLDQYRRYLVNPSIELIFLRRINVLGSVRAPGLYPVDPTMVVADALAMAGGVAPDGRQDQIQLIRGGEILTADITHRTRIADLPIRSGDQLFVPERSWLSRHSSVVVSSAVTLFTLFVGIFATR